MRLLILLALSAFSWGAYACTVSAPESFDSFFAKFRSDLVFEKERTSYPYRVNNHTEERSWTVKVSAENDTRQKPLDTVAKEKGFVFDRPVTKVGRATAKLYAPNTGYSMEFKFQKKNGCWKFTVLDVNDF
jgi:hypothetical protein